MTTDTTTPRLGWQNERPRSRRECEIRVLRGLATMRSPAVVKTVMAGVKSAMPSYVHDETDLKWQEELVAEDDTVLDVFRPDRRDLTDWDTALIWYTAIMQDEDRHPGREAWSLTRHQKVIKWRSYGLQTGEQPTWAFIARHMERSVYDTRQWYDHGIDRAWRAAQVWDMSRGAVSLDKKEKVA